MFVGRLISRYAEKKQVKIYINKVLNIFVFKVEVKLHSQLFCFELKICTSKKITHTCELKGAILRRCSLCTPPNFHSQHESPSSLIQISGNIAFVFSTSLFNLHFE
jgi:hypothetical protein